MTAVTVLTDTPLELGEGARLVDGSIVLVDLLAGTLYAHPGDRLAPLETLTSVGMPLGAVAPVRGQRDEWIAAIGDGVAFLVPGQPPQWLGHPEAHKNGRTRMNDGACDPSGRFWAGSMAYDGESPEGALYRVDADGSIHQVLDDIVISNGPAFSLDGTHMFLADSGRGTITRFDVDSEGWPTAPTVVVRESAGVVPDGMTTDLSGALWVAMWGGGQLRRYSPDGDLLAAVPLPAAQPTSVALSGDRAVVTTACIGLDTPGPHDGLVLSVALRDVGGSGTSLPARRFG